LSKDAFALVNADDKNGMVMLQNTKAKKVTYGLKGMADYKAQVLENQFFWTALKNRPKRSLDFFVRCF